MKNEIAPDLWLISSHQITVSRFPSRAFCIDLTSHRNQRKICEPIILLDPIKTIDHSTIIEKRSETSKPLNQWVYFMHNTKQENATQTQKLQWFHAVVYAIITVTSANVSIKRLFFQWYVTRLVKPSPFLRTLISATAESDLVFDLCLANNM